MAEVMNQGTAVPMGFSSVDEDAEIERAEIYGLLARIGNHPAFAGAGADRLRMCSDCRVIDMHTNPNEVTIKDI